MPSSSSSNDRQARARAAMGGSGRSKKGSGTAIVVVAILLGLAIIAAAAFVPVKNWWQKREWEGKDLASIGAPASVCGEVTTQKANGNQEHLDEGTQIEYDTAPPAFGKHWPVPEQMERKFYTAEDRPELEALVHNLEHGYTVLWYDETAAEDDEMMKTIRGIATKFDSTTDQRDKFKAVPWTSDDKGKMPEGQHIALTHWSAGGAGTTEVKKQVGVFQYCKEPSGEALDDFMAKYPYMDSPEPNGM